MGKIIDLTGQKYNRLSAIKFLEIRKNNAIWLFECDCGETIEGKASDVRRGHTKSCGCYHIDKITKHGIRHTKLYNIHSAIKDRCYNPNCKAYHNYGGRGITMCQEWLDSNSGVGKFYEWAMSNGYKEGLSIERINVNGNYEPSNCKWATYKEQNNNTRRTNFIKINGVTKKLTEWAEISGLSTNVILDRYKKGLVEEDLLKKPHFKNKAKNLPQSGHVGINWNTNMNKWSVRVRIAPKKRKYLGVFDELKDAIFAKEELERQLNLKN